jgi:TRAP-type C4-dicarboxylate transport system permease small subunit
VIGRLMHKANALMAEFSGWLITFIMVLLVFDASSRVFGKAIPGVVEVGVFALVASVYLGLSKCEEDESHLRVEYFFSFLKGRGRKASEIVDYLVAIPIIAFALYASFRSAQFSLKTNEALSGTIALPIAPAKFTIVVGLALYLAQLLLNLHLISRRRNPS